MSYFMRDSHDKSAYKNRRRVRPVDWAMAIILILALSFVYGFVEGTLKSKPAPSAKK